MTRVIALLLVVVAVTLGFIWLAQPVRVAATHPAYCMGSQTAELCRDMDTRDKTEFRA